MVWIFFKSFHLNTASTKGRIVDWGGYWSLYLEPCYGSVLICVVIALGMIEVDMKWIVGIMWQLILKLAKSKTEL